MASFTSLISSLQNSKDLDSASSAGDAAPVLAASSTKSTPSLTQSRPPSTTGLKRKSDKTVKEEPRKTAKLANDLNGAAKTVYQGTMKARPSPQPSPAARPVPGAKAQQQSTTIVKAPPASVSQPKRGFAQLMAKAQAAQEVVKATGPDTIRHKATTILSKKDRIRRAQEMQTKANKSGAQAETKDKSAASNKSIVSRPAKDEVVYTGTMRSKSTSAADEQSKRKAAGLSRNDSYASWSDLDAEDDEEGYYDSESDMDEAGFDDMMDEELKAERIAKREDQLELEDEERRKREKLQRQRRLQALNSTAAATKKRF